MRLGSTADRQPGLAPYLRIMPGPLSPDDATRLSAAEYGGAERRQCLGRPRHLLQESAPRLHTPGGLGRLLHRSWLILTDLAPEQADVCWYSLRAWIECGFKDTKRGGWQWQQTKIVEPARAARLWLAIAVATLWVLSVGGEADDNLPVSTLADLPATHIARRRTTQRSQPRLLSCFRRGLLCILAAAIRGETLPQGRFDPEPWPTSAVPDTSGIFMAGPG